MQAFPMLARACDILVQVQLFSGELGWMENLLSPVFVRRMQIPSGSRAMRSVRALDSKQTPKKPGAGE